MSQTQVKVCTITDPGQLNKLTSEAEFYCSRCGAKSHDQANVCEPVRL
jgi:hypothetical protein